MTLQVIQGFVKEYRCSSRWVRHVKTEVVRTSIECRPDRFDVDRAEWYKPFEDIQNALDYAEYQIRTKLREHE